MKENDVVVKQQEFKFDPVAINIGTEWVCHKQRHTDEAKIKAQFLGRDFADDTKKGELLVATPRLPAFQYLVCRHATRKCAAPNLSVSVMDVHKRVLT